MDKVEFACKPPKIVGIYGISGSGKSHLVNELRTLLANDTFLFFNGSAVIDEVVPGGLDEFNSLDSRAQKEYRVEALRHIKETCARSSCTGIVSGHYMLWEDGPEIVWTSEDAALYTHIFYLDTPPVTVSEYRINDTKKPRPTISLEQLAKWQMREIAELGSVCQTNSILFATVTASLRLKLHILLRDIHVHDEERNLDAALLDLDNFLHNQSSSARAVLVLDADKTLAPYDAGFRFWTYSNGALSSGHALLYSVFSGHMGYSYLAFRQAVFIYEQTVDDATYEEICEKLAHEVDLYPDMYGLIRMARQKNVTVIVVTSGLVKVWSRVMDEMFSGIKVIGGNRLSDEYVVSPKIKAEIVRRLQNKYHKLVWAFGDSPIDLPMLTAADHAVVVVPDTNIRSKSMKLALTEAVTYNGLKARQVLFPDSVPPLHIPGVLIVQLDNAMIHAIVDPMPGFQYRIASTEAAQILATGMRNANNSSHSLRRSHHRVGWYLATHYLSTHLGVSTIDIPHVLGHTDKGFTFADESSTLIVPLMRAGEPLAYGISEAMPAAVVRHAKLPVDLPELFILKHRTIILVDAVINTGASILEFVKYIRFVDPRVKIVIVAGIVQEEFLGCQSGDELGGAGGGGKGLLERYLNVYLVGLRMSATKFKGAGKTDTGARLFNTTTLE